MRLAATAGVALEAFGTAAAFAVVVRLAAGLPEDPVRVLAGLVGFGGVSGVAACLRRAFDASAVRVAGAAVADVAAADVLRLPAGAGTGAAVDAVAAARVRLLPRDCPSVTASPCAGTAVLSARCTLAG